MDAPDSRAGSAALMALGVVIALACVSAIGAATALVVMAVDEQAAPATAVAAYGGDCAVVAWQSGMTYCFRSGAGGIDKLAGRDPAGVIQAQADSAR